MTFKERMKEQGRSLTWLADQLGITRGAVSSWDVVPTERVLKVEEVTGISRYDLRPDVFGEAPASGEAA